MLHIEIELEVAYELSSRLHYIIYLHYITRFCFFFYLVCNNKKQPYIPSRKAVEHVERTKHVGKKKKVKTKKKKIVSI